MSVMEAEIISSAFHNILLRCQEKAQLHHVVFQWKTETSKQKTKTIEMKKRHKNELAEFSRSYNLLGSGSGRNFCSILPGNPSGFVVKPGPRFLVFH